MLVVLDTVRADRLSCYGNERETTPALDRLALRGTRFVHAQSAAPWTIPSMASLWTGVLPSTHGAGVPTEPKAFAGKGSYRGFDERALATLPQQLARQGYRNFAFVANPVLERMACFLGSFERSSVSFVKAEVAVGAVRAWLPELEPSQPFFLYLHLMDAHQPLNPPRRYRDLFVTDGQPRDDKRYAAWGDLNQPEHMRSPLLPSFRANKLAVYDGALRYMDDQLEKLFQELEQRGLLDQTLIVVTADHGEEFWDHGVEQTELYDCSVRAHTGVGHGQTQFQELLAVPLVIAGPGVAAGVVETRVSLLDLGATLLELATGARGAFGDGQSFGALLCGEAAAGHALLAEEVSLGYELKALVQPDGLKYILAHHEGEQDCLFDLAQDPLEKHNLLAERPDLARRLRTELTELVAAASAKQAAPGAPSDADVSALQGLGYAGESTPKPRERPTPKKLNLKPRR